METRPGEEPLESLFEIEELRDSVMSAWGRLSEEDQFVLGARIIEGLAFEAVGARIGVSKTQARRMAIAAKERLKGWLLAEDSVRIHIGYEKSWNMAVRKALLDLAPAGDEVDVIMEWGITRNMSEAKSAIRSDESRASWDLVNIGICAAGLLSNQGHWDVGKMERLLCSKQADYGTGNIKAFGLHGVLVRMSDKVARWEHLMMKGTKPENESMQDTLMDMVGYAAVTLLLERGEFELPLEVAE